MKIKLKNPNAAAAAAAAGDAHSPPLDAAAALAPLKLGGLKLTLKPTAPVAPEAADGELGDGQKPKRKYNKKPKLDESGNPVPTGKSGPKKRARDDGDDVDSPAAKRKPKPTAKSLAMVDESDDDERMVSEPPPTRPRPPPARTQSIKLSIKPKGSGPSAPQRSSTAILKVKGGGKPPIRPYGVGYDSEADEAEPDPAIESQFILRMTPGPDCDLLRKSIEDKQIGKSMAAGGPGVYFRFFDREGRRAMVTIQGRLYAASMVELPTVIESMKSWNKKDWVKTADVCQMLLVLGQVQNEDEAKKYPRPSYVEPDSHRYPHGLTPPMRWARKLRFRPRKSYLDVERAEAQMTKLMAEDESAQASKYELVDSDHGSADQSSGDEELDEDMLNGMQPLETPVEEVDAGDLEAMLAEGFMEDENIEIQADGATLDALLGDQSTLIEPATPATAHDVAIHALNQNSSIIIETETAASTPAAMTSADDDDDDDDAESDEDGDDVDDAAVAEEQRKEQLRGEIAEMDKVIQDKMDKLANTTNQIFKRRLQNELDKQLADRDIKRNQLGEDAAE
jgi:transcription initiation factor TFIID subunit 7